MGTKQTTKLGQMISEIGAGIPSSTKHSEPILVVHLRAKIEHCAHNAVAIVPPIYVIVSHLDRQVVREQRVKCFKSFKIFLSLHDRERFEIEDFRFYMHHDVVLSVRHLLPPSRDLYLLIPMHSAKTDLLLPFYFERVWIRIHKHRPGGM